MPSFHPEDKLEIYKGTSFKDHNLLKFYSICWNFLDCYNFNIRKANIYKAGAGLYAGFYYYEHEPRSRSVLCCAEISMNIWLAL